MQIIIINSFHDGVLPTSKIEDYARKMHSVRSVVLIDGWHVKIYVDGVLLQRTRLSEFVTLI